MRRTAYDDAAGREAARMTWYAVNLLFKSTREDGSLGLWEESLRLVEAGTEQEALEKGRALGAAEGSESFETISGVRVEWTFERAERAYAIDADLGEGTELFSRFLRESEVASLLTPFDDE